MRETGDETRELQAIIDSAAHGADGAWDRLIVHASERLLRLTRRQLRNYPRLRRWEQTDDVFQNSVLRLHRSLADVKPESVRQFFGLAATQIRRTLIDLARHHFGAEGAGARHHSDYHGRAPDDPGGVIHNRAMAPGQPETLAQWASFHETVEQLPDEEREVFEFVWYGGLEQAEIARMIGVSVPTVKRRWRMARVLIFEALEGQRPQS